MKIYISNFFILLLFFISTVNGYTVAVSPSHVYLDHRNHGWLTLINTNDQRMYYELNSTAQLTRSTGVIEPSDKVQIGISTTKETTMLVSFQPQFQTASLDVLPQLRIPITPYEVSVSDGIRIMFLVIVIGLVMMGITAFLVHRVFGSSIG